MLILVAADDLFRLMERLPAAVETLREIRALAAGQFIAFSLLFMLSVEWLRRRAGGR